MSSNDWSQDEPMASVEPSTDLFDGDILGDELMDIYNAAVVGGGDDDAMNEIPALLAPTPDSLKKDQVDLNDPDSPSHDDGLGAFRPSTSFNDLSTLLPPTTPAPPVAAPSSLPPVATSLAPEDNGAKKRGLESASIDVPASKRRTSASRKGSPSAAKSKSKGGGGSATQKSAKAVAKAKPHSAARGKQYNKNDTPNPLTIGKPQPPTLAAKVPTKAATKSMTAHLTAVVTPRAPVATKEVDTKKTPSAPQLVSSSPTEADFKSVAQAAISNLMLNAGNGTKAETTPSTTVSKDVAANVDTSTEHIKALTGSNWVSVCSGGDPGPASNVNADKMNNRARRQNLTPDERARQNRDRNREHARNTRLRKKAYVEELKRTLTSLVAQRDAAELEKRHTVQRELEQREVRFRVIEEFLKLRGRNEVNFARWAAILEETFSLTLPMTDFRSMVHSESNQSNNGFEQVLTGVNEAMADSNLLASFVQRLCKQNGKEEVSFAYSCDRKNFFMDNCFAVLDWTASTQRSASELTIKGNLKAHFSPASNKLISVVMTYDTGVVVSQVNEILKGNDGCTDDVAAAQVAASEADAILDSLQMPHMPASVPANVTVLNSDGPASITDVEKEDSSDESNGDTDDAARISVKA